MGTIADSHPSKRTEYIKNFEKVSGITYEDTDYAAPNNVPKHLLEYVARIKIEQILRDKKMMNVPLATTPKARILTEQDCEILEKEKHLDAKMKLWQGCYSH